MGGSDQWGNITAGIDLIRRRQGARAHGLTFPLIMRADGEKFGKSAGGAVWLSAERTSPYAFYQYWMNVDDRDAERFLLQLTLLPVTDVAEIMVDHVEAPHRRGAQRRLAHELTALVHGDDAAEAAATASQLLFGGDPGAAPASSLAMLERELPTAPVPSATLDAGVPAVDLAVASGLVTSRSDAGRALTAGELHVNGRRLEPGAEVTRTDLLHDRYLLVRRGKKRYALLVVA